MTDDERELTTKIDWLEDSLLMMSLFVWGLCEFDTLTEDLQKIIESQRVTNKRLFEFMEDAIQHHNGTFKGIRIKQQHRTPHKPEKPKPSNIGMKQHRASHEQADQEAT